MSTGVRQAAAGELTVSHLTIGADETARFIAEVFDA